MTQLTIAIQDEHGKVKAEQQDTGEVHLVYAAAYEPGDVIVLKSDDTPVFLRISLDEALGEELIYMTGQEYILPIPFGEKKSSYSPKTFAGELHVLSAIVAKQQEVHAYRNLARNVYDHHWNEALFPHAHANVETRGEAVFAARNAINGNTVTFSHGEWPFESWGINQNLEAAFTLEFGRVVQVEEIVLYLRADFPHDSYWQQVTLEYSDGTRQTVALEKSDKGQTVEVGGKQVEWVKLHELIQADDPSPFPALTQFVVYGSDR
ncbi:carbohydrate-binding protein [Paenibacillus sp. WLX2291]|uniref:carbohydrate-binding protein n=1 Tax=Paenibacillus sp. WLX2291 TaxID=3296934 RepID=UPI003984166B